MQKNEVEMEKEAVIEEVKVEASKPRTLVPKNKGAYWKEDLGALSIFEGVPNGTQSKCMSNSISKGYCKCTFQ